MRQKKCYTIWWRSNDLVIRWECDNFEIDRIVPEFNDANMRGYLTSSVYFYPREIYDFYER